MEVFDKCVEYTATVVVFLEEVHVSHKDPTHPRSDHDPWDHSHEVRLCMVNRLGSPLDLAIGFVMVAGQIVWIIQEQIDKKLSQLR